VVEAVAVAAVASVAVATTTKAGNPCPADKFFPEPRSERVAALFCPGTTDH
jgi:hypothetical protein